MLLPCFFIIAKYGCSHFRVGLDESVIHERSSHGRQRVNKVILIGNLGKDRVGADISKRGGRVAHCHHGDVRKLEGQDFGERNGKNGNMASRVGSLTKISSASVERVLKKGSKVFIRGASWRPQVTDQSGQDKYTTEVVLRPYRANSPCLDSIGPGGGSGSGAGSNDSFGLADCPAPRERVGGPGGDPGIDDEIPFLGIVGRRLECRPFLRAKGTGFISIAMNPMSLRMVHVDREGSPPKFWLFSVALARNVGYNAKELGELLRMVTDCRNDFMEAWHDHFGF